MSGIADMVRRFGWATQTVFPRMGDNDPHQPFAYTIGLEETLGQPDLLMIGFSGESSHAVMSIVIDRLRAGAIALPLEGGIAKGVYEGQSGMIDLKVDVVPPLASEALCVQARNHYGRDRRVVQIVMPDVNGRFPGDKGVDPRFAERQDLLALVAKMQPYDGLQPN